MERTVHQSRELTQKEIELFLGEHSHGRLGLCVEGEPYVVPVAYGYSQGVLYFHTGKRGKKVEFIKRNNRVCFEVDEWQKGWASVICYGKIELRDDFESKKKCFELLAGKDLPEGQIAGASVYIGTIDVGGMTGRCSVDFKFC